MLWFLLIMTLVQQIYGYPSHKLPEDNSLRFFTFNSNGRHERPARQFGFQSNGFDFNRPPAGFQNDNIFFFDSENFENRNAGGSSTEQPVTTARPPFTGAVPGMGTTRSPCEVACQTTPEYNPVCGDDNMTYFTRNRLKCAQRCGKRVSIKHLGACRRS